MPFILAFIAFNLLDLDASDLAALTRCFDHFVVDADLTAPPGVDPSHLEKVRTHRYHVSLPRDSVPGLGSCHHGGAGSACQEISPFLRAARVECFVHSPSVSARSSGLSAQFDE